MLGIKIRDTFLSLYANTSLTFEKNHPIGIITDALDTIQGGYSFPIDIPLDDINTSIIGHLDRLDVDSILLQDEYCEVWIEGLLLEIGKANVKQCGPRTASLFMVFNELKDLSDVHLAALDYEGVRTIGTDAASRTAYADDTVENPMDHDFIFAPVYNPNYSPFWNEGYPAQPQRNYQNFYSSDNDGFEEIPISGITPFIRLDYLLNRIFQYQGFTLDNQFQLTDELKLILLWNNYNINTHYQAVPDVASAWDNTVDLKNHVPSRAAIELLKALVGTFALGLFYDPSNKSALLIPFDTLIANPEAADWTSKTAQDFNYVTDRNFISRWRYDVDTADGLSVRFGGQDFPQNIVMGEGLTARIMYGDGEFLLRRAIADNTYYIIAIGIGDANFNTAYTAQDQKQVVKTGSDKEYASELIPLWNSHDIKTNGEDDFDHTDIRFQEIMLPAIEHEGFIVNYVNPFSSIFPPLAPCMSFRVMMYRGFQPADVGIDYEYPMANTSAYNIRGEQVGDYSLQWDGDYGIYNKFWKRPYEMLAHKKDVTRSLNLTIRDLINFRFWHKIRIENQNYFMTRLRYTVTSKGLSPVEATMITTL